MKTVLLAAALVALCSAPVAADWSKPRSHAKKIYVKPASKQLTPEQIRRRKFEETYVDPYFEECNYMTNYGTDGCGGN
jgi:hypothetical protein